MYVRPFVCHVAYMPPI